MVALSAVGSDRPERLAVALRDDALGDFTAASPWAACLMPLLTALGWHGSPRDVAEALPHFADTLDLTDLRNVLVTLGYESQSVSTSLHRLDPRLFPCLFAGDRGGAMVITGRTGDVLHGFDGVSGGSVELPAGAVRGTAFFFTDVGSGQRAASRQRAPTSWFGTLVRRFVPTVRYLLLMTLVINIVALLVPIFIMVVYDRVIGTESLGTLTYLVAGIIVAMACDLALRVLRSELMGSLAGRLDYLLGVEAFRQILTLSPNYTETASVGSQIARLKQFETVREFFTGPLAAVALELPFMILFIAVIALIAGPVAAVPVVMIAAFAVIGLVYLPGLRAAVGEASGARAARQNFLVEALGSMRSVKGAAAETAWHDRYRMISANAVSAHLRTARKSAMLQTAAHMLMMLSGIAVLAWGTLRVMDGLMTVGALIATMALVWRVLSPLQTGFLAFTRLEQVTLSIRQLNRLMRLPAERQINRTAPLTRTFRGQVSFNRVSFRYSPDTDPALLGVTFSVEPGELLAVIGPNGSGKSTVLKLLASMYQPQAGAVSIDGLDLRQIDPVELRRTLAYVPQTPHLFHGTIAQNIRLADATASDERVAKAAAEAGVLHSILDLPGGFETRIGDLASAHLPSGFSQRLVIARALVREAPVLLFDEPATSLDEVGDRSLMELLERLRGHSTVLMVSHRPSHVRLANRVVLLDRGAMAFLGEPDMALQMMGQMQA